LIDHDLEEIYTDGAISAFIIILLFQKYIQEKMTERYFFLCCLFGKIFFSRLFAEKTII